MATRYFDATISADVNYVGERFWKGDDINKLWYLFNYDSSNRAVWGLDSNGWLQYKSAFPTYAGRYNTDDLTLGDTFFEVELQPTGMGNYEVGFFMRFTDRYSFYYLSYNGGYKNWNGKNIRLVKVVGTTHVVVAEYACPVFDRNTVYKFRAELVGNNIKIYLDGTKIIDYTDLSPNPYVQGAFGPWVLGQEFAKWKGFQARNNSPFTISQQIKNESVTSDFYDPSTARLLVPQTVGQLLQDELDAYLATVPSYDSFNWKSFRLSATDSRVNLIFDRVAGKNVSTDPNSRIYVYQTLPTSPPLAPTNLQAVALSPDSIRLTWSHADDSEDGFRIYDENDNLIATVSENTLVYTETGLTESTTYRRKVVAFNNAGESLPSNTVSVTTLATPPAAPTNFRVISFRDTQAEWAWDDMSTNETSFELITWDDQGNVVVVATGIGKDQTRFVETGLTPQTKYIRGVRAVNAAGKSAPSNPYEITTLEKLPDPPKYAPVNFYGLGVSDEAIFWYWDDINPDAEGFELVDKDDKVVAIIGQTERQYLETGLYSLNVYQRKIRAFNRGGKGPETPLASARTLSDGLNQIGKPVPPTDLYAEVLSRNEVKLTWKYEEDVHFPAVGFKIYFGDGSLVMAIPKDLREQVIGNLLPNTTYRMYLVAYNDNGESLATNTVEFLTPNIVPTPPDPIENGDLEDPFYGIDYDKETLETPKLKAFQSGVGDRLDLVARNLRPSLPNIETFQYEMYITGEYTEIIEGKPYQRIWESARIVSKQIEIQEGEVLRIVDQMPSPMYEILWQEINPKWPISNYKLIFTSTNPNVELTLEREITNFFPTDSTFIEVPIKARIINETQTAWYPSIHSGYYYLNQQEWFLYADDRAQPKDGGIDETYVLKFPYLIKATGGQHYDAQDISYVDTLRMDFLQGEMTDGISLERELGSITLNDGFTDGTFISRIFRFGRPVTQWGAIEITQDDQAIFDGAKLDVFVGACDYLGNVTDWIPQTPGQPISLSAPADKIRYKLVLHEGMRRDYQNPHIYVDPTTLSNGYKVRTIVVQDAIRIDNLQTSADGTYVTPPLYIGENVDSFGTLTLNIDQFGDSELRIFSCSSDNDKHDFTRPTTESPWIPVPFTYDPLNRTYNLTISSVPKKYLALIFQLKRGKNKGVALELTEANFDPSRAVNLKWENGQLTLIDPTTEGIYTSQPYYMGTLSGFDPLSLVMDPTNGRVTVETVSGPTQADVLNASAVPSAWKQVTTSVQSPLDPWFMYRIRIRPTKGTCVNRHHTKDSYDEFVVHSGRTNMNIVDWINDHLAPIDKSKPSSYTSEEIPVALLDSIVGMKVIADAYRGMKLFISEKVGGVWQPEKSYGINDNGDAVGATFPIPMNEGTHIRYRLEINPQNVDPKTNELRSYNIENTPGFVRNQDGNKISFTSYGFGSNPSVKLNNPDNNVTTYMWESPVIPTGADYGLRSLSFTGLFNWISIYYRIDDYGSIRVELRGLRADGSWTDWVGGVIPLPNPMPTNTGSEVTNSIKLDLPEACQSYQFRVYLRSGRVSYYPGYGGNEFQSPFIKAMTEFFEPTFANVPQKIYSITVDARECDPIPTKVTSMKLQSFAYVSPVVSDIHLRPSTYAMTRVVPRVDEIKISGHIDAGYALETYAVPMMGELVMDRKEYPITTKIVEDLVYEYLASKGILLDSKFVFTDYLLQIDPVYPVELRTERNGLDRVYGKATREAGEKLYRNVKIYFDPNTQSVLLRPIPQQGHPICVKNAAGQLLRQVHFRDALGYPTLTNEEETVVEHKRYLFLQHREIDRPTVKVYLEIDKNWVEVHDFEVIANRIVLSNNYPSGTRARVSYKLRNSFVVNYNYDPKGDVCELKVNTLFDPNVKDTHYLEVKYEVEKETAYYLAKEVDLNPLRTAINSGFLYLTDTVYPPFTIDVRCNPNVLYLGRDDRVVINAIILDEFGNPVIDEKADFSVNVGTIQVLRRTSDHNGMVTAVYIAPQETTEEKAIINIHIISRDISKQISRTVEIFFANPKAKNKIAILPEKHVVRLGDSVQLKVRVMGANNEPLTDRNVQLYADQGILTPLRGKTDANGELMVTYQFVPPTSRNITLFPAEEKSEGMIDFNFMTKFEWVGRYLESDTTDGYVYIEAETYDDNLNPIRDQILLGISGV